MQYVDRELRHVVLKNIRTGIDGEGQEIAVGTVLFEVASRYENEPEGPSITAQIGIDYLDGDSVAALERRPLEAAHALVTRIANENFDSLQEVYRRERDDRNRPDPLAELQKEWEKPAE